MAGLSEQDFIELVEQAEREATDNLSRYKLKLALFAALGYLVIFAVFAVLVLLLGGTVALALISSSLFLLLIKKKFIVVIIAMIWTCARALWVRFEAPSGFELQRKDYPELFEQIDQLRTELNALKIHQVILENELNAAVVQHPRFGILGGQRNILFLGLELLLILNPAEARAVLAHEFGHLSNDHSRFSGWIYRVRLSWQRIMQSFAQNNSFGAKLMRRFFDWYAPRFSAYSFALARNNEYEADRIAAQLTSPADAASALVNIHAQAPHLDQQYWREYYKQADTLPEPATLPYTGLATYLANNPITRAQLLEQIKRAMRTETHYADTHPALKDRLANITDSPALPVISESAAQAWLGDKLPDLLAHFDQAWLVDNQTRWQRRHDYVSRAKQAIAAAETADITQYDDQQLWDLACYSDEFATPALAIERYRHYLQRHPQSPGAAFYLGALLAAQDDLTVLNTLSIALDSAHTFHDAANTGFDLIERAGSAIDKYRWEQQVEQKYQRICAAIADRDNLDLTSDQLQAATIGDEALTALRRVLAAQKNVGSVWLAEKVQRDPDVFKQPLYALAFDARGIFLDYSTVTGNLSAALAECGDFFVLATKGETKALAKAVKKCGRKIK